VPALPSTQINVPRDEALLTRLHDNHIHKFVVRPEDKLREHFAGAIEAACARGLAPVFDFEPGDDKLIEFTPQPAPRRQRKRSLAKVCEAARKAGADRVIVDGVVIALSTAAAPKSTTNEWDVVLPEDDHGAR
jgi:hypothetical protein